MTKNLLHGTTRAGAETADDSRSLDETLDLLADFHRRKAIQCLIAREDGSIATEKLLESVIEARAAADAGTVPSYDELFVAFHHLHLPAMEDQGIITHDSARSVVRYQQDDVVESIIADVPDTLEPE